MRPQPDTETFRNVNVNPKGRNTGDCVIRALASVTSNGWDDVLDSLVEIAHRTKYSVASREVYTEYLNGYGFVQRKQIKHFDGKKYTGEQFCRYLDELTEETGKEYVVFAHIGTKHVTSFKMYNGKYRIHDTWNCGPWCVGIFYIREVL